MVQEHLLILLCSGIQTDSDNLHFSETSRVRQCPQVLICHPLLSSWVEFNYPTNLGIAMPDVGYADPDISNGRIWCIPERAGKQFGEMGLETGHETGDRKFVMSSSEPDVTPQSPRTFGHL